MRRLALLLALVLPPALAHAGTVDPVATVRRYFAALNHNDFDRAIALTAGAARARTERMVGEIKEKAARARASVDVEVKKVDARPTPGDRVEVEFAIDVVGKKWMFRRVARRIAGLASFRVDGDRIVAIDGALDE